MASSPSRGAFAERTDEILNTPPPAPLDGRTPSKNTSTKELLETSQLMLGAIASLKKKYRARSRMRMSMTGGGTPGAGTGQRAFQSMMVETTGRDGPADGGGGDKENGAGISIRKAGSPLDIEFLREEIAQFKAMYEREVDERAKLEDEVESLDAQLAAAQADADAMEDALEEAQVSMAEKDIEISALTTDLASVRSSLSLSDEMRTHLEQEVANLNTALAAGEAMKTELADQLAALQKSREVESVVARDIEELQAARATMTAELSAAAEAHQRALGEAAGWKAKYEAEAEERADAVADLTAALDNAKMEREVALGELVAMQRELNAEVDDREELEGQYEAMRRRALQAEMRALDAEDVAATAAAELEEAKGNAARLKAQLEGDGRGSGTTAGNEEPSDATRGPSKVQLIAKVHAKTKELEAAMAMVEDLQGKLVKASSLDGTRTARISELETELEVYVKTSTSLAMENAELSAKLTAATLGAPVPGNGAGGEEAENDDADPLAVLHGEPEVDIDQENFSAILQLSCTGDSFDVDSFINHVQEERRRVSSGGL